MKRISKQKFRPDLHGCQQGIMWPVVALEDGTWVCDDDWQILGWCKNPPIDEFNKGYALMFECIKSYEASDVDVLAGTKVWYHYTAKELEGNGISGFFMLRLAGNENCKTR